MVEKHWGNDQWTNQRYWQDWACKTQDEQNTTQKPKKMNNYIHILSYYKLFIYINLCLKCNFG
jgi:hypothetical protein